MPQGLTLVSTGRLKHPFASNGFSDMWKAGNDGQIFAIRSIRTYEVDDFTHMKKVLWVCLLVRQYLTGALSPRSTVKWLPSVGELGTKYSVRQRRCASAV